jgi:ABC-type lipoprotein release transport system permease subunit
VKPLSPTTFLLRNAGKTLPLIAVIVLAVMLIMSIVALMNSIPLSIKTTYSYSQKLLAITPRGDPTQLPNIQAKLKADAPVELRRVITCRASLAQVNSIVGKWDFVVFGMNPSDLKFYLNLQGVKEVEGRLPKPGAPEAIISKPVARNLKLKVGSTLLSPDNQDMYSPKEVKVVGIADTEMWLMANDVDYQRQNHFPPVDNVLAFAKEPSQQDQLDRWAVEAFKGDRAYVFAYHVLEKQTNDMFNILYKILNVVIYVLVVVITIMMGMLMNIYQSQRLVEFGLLQAIGFTKRELLTRVLAETVLVLLTGWALGIACGFAVLNLVKAQMFDPAAFALNALDLTALRYTVPAPVAIAIVAFFTVWLRFRKFDPVGVVERRLV